MPARDLSEQLEIKKPCTADWNEMVGNSRVRFCEHCQLTVNDLSSLTPKRVRRLIAKSKGRLCVRYVRDRNGNPLLAQVPGQLQKISRRVSRIAAGMFTATLSLTNASGHVAPTTAANYERSFQPSQSQAAAVVAPLGSAISGKITDSSGAPISNVGITLLTLQRAFLSGAISNSAGEYSFEGLVPGRYWVALEAHGYRSPGTMYALVTADETLILNHTLEREADAIETLNLATSGAVALVREAADPLIAAAIDDDLQALEAVLTRENVNVRDGKLDTTALEYAVRHGNREMVQVLLTAGADVNSVDSDKQTVLMMLGEDATADIVWDLVNAGAKLELKDDEGDTALIEAASEENLPVLVALLHAGAKVDAKNKEGQTALMQAATNGHPANIRALMRAGADLNAQDNDGWTALDYAYSDNAEKIIKLLLSYGAVTGIRKQQ
jgi:ankyrin repeat protein